MRFLNTQTGGDIVLTHTGEDKEITLSEEDIRIFYKALGNKIMEYQEKLKEF